LAELYKLEASNVNKKIVRISSGNLPLLRIFGSNVAWKSRNPKTRLQEEVIFGKGDEDLTYKELGYGLYMAQRFTIEIEVSDLL